MAVAISFFVGCVVEPWQVLRLCPGQARRWFPSHEFMVLFFCLCCRESEVKWTFLTGLNRTMVENCGKMEVFDRTK